MAVRPSKLACTSNDESGSRGFLDFNLDLGRAAGIGDRLGIERRRAGTGKAERQARTRAQPRRPR